MVPRDGWVPISQERSAPERARRLRTVEARLREHRNRRAGLDDCCQGCGGHPEAEPRDRCDCDSRHGVHALIARCYRNAREAHNA